MSLHVDLPRPKNTNLRNILFSSFVLGSLFLLGCTASPEHPVTHSQVVTTPAVSLDENPWLTANDSIPNTLQALSNQLGTVTVHKLNPFTHNLGIQIYCTEGREVTTNGKPATMKLEISGLEGHITFSCEGPIGLNVPINDIEKPFDLSLYAESSIRWSAVFFEDATETIFENESL